MIYAKTVPSVSTMKPLSIIVAVDHRGGFSKKGKIPWHYSEDLAVFKLITTGNICIMGRNTYEEILEMRVARSTKNDSSESTSVVETDFVLLPERESYVLSRDPSFIPKGAKAGKSLRAVCESLNADERREIFVIGGEKLFIEALSWANKVYMTVIDKDYQCDRFFPTQFVDKHFTIERGQKKGELYFIEYRRK